MSNQVANNTDVELWRTTKDDYYSRNKIYVTETGGITICDGSFCTTRPAYEWWALANPEGKDAIVKRLQGATTKAPRVDERVSLWKLQEDAAHKFTVDTDGSAICYLCKEPMIFPVKHCTQPPVEAPAPALGGLTVECYPTPTPEDAKKFLCDIVDDTEDFTGKTYWLCDADGKAVAVTGCGPKGESNARRLALTPPAPVAIGEDEAVDIMLRGYVEQVYEIPESDEEYEETLRGVRNDCSSQCAIFYRALLPYLTQGKQVEALVEACQRVLVGGNHLAIHIGHPHPLKDASYDEALEHYGATVQYDVWCCWKTIMLMRDVLESAPFAATQDSGRV